MDAMGAMRSPGAHRAKAGGRPDGGSGGAADGAQPATTADSGGPALQLNVVTIRNRYHFLNKLNTHLFRTLTYVCLFYYVCFVCKF